MSGLTRANIQQIAQNLVDETENKPGYAAPFLWNFFIDLITDELAALDGIYITLTQDIVANQQSYQYPQIQKITAINALDTSGNPWLLEAITPPTLDQRCPMWRQNNSESSLPEFAVLQGKSSILLYPTPNYSESAALIVEGFGCPSSAGVNGTNVWGASTDVCPLPYNMHKAVAFGVAFQRCVQFPTPENKLRVPGLKNQYDTMVAQFMAEIQDASSAQDFGDAPDTSLNLMGYYGSSYGV